MLALLSCAILAVTINGARFAVNSLATSQCVLLRREFSDDCTRCRKLGLLIDSDRAIVTTVVCQLYVTDSM